MKRKSGLSIKKEIIKQLKQKETSLRKLETKLNTNNNTIKTHCKELEFFGIIKIIQYKRNDRNGRPYKVAKLTSYGTNIKV